MAMQEATLSFWPSGSAPAMGRRVLEGFGDGIGDRALDDARLLLTELLTNAVRHGGLRPEDRISVSIRREASGLIVTVTDPGVGFGPDLPSQLPNGGWGFMLLDRLAREWGVESRPGGGSIVWFRITLDDA